MGYHDCEICGHRMCGESFAPECGCYDCLCEDCCVEVCQDSDCAYCDGRDDTCDRCDMVEKGESWHQCPAANCPVKERLEDNCCEHCWKRFLADVSRQPGVIKVVGAMTGDFIKEAQVLGEDRFRVVENLMAKDLNLPVMSLSFLNSQQIKLTSWDRIQNISTKITHTLNSPMTSSSPTQKVMIAEWFPQPGVPRFHSETGSHESRKLPCGHFSCVLADKGDDCAVCAELREKAAARHRELREKEAARRRAKEAAKKEQIENDNILADLKELQRMKIKSAALQASIAQLAAKSPQGKALLQEKSLRAFKVIGENKITIFAEPTVDGRKVGTLEPGVCFDVVEQKASDGRTYLRLSGDLGWTYTTSKKDVRKVVVCEVQRPQAGAQGDRPQPSPARARPQGAGAPSAKRYKT